MIEFCLKKVPGAAGGPGAAAIAVPQAAAGGPGAAAIAAPQLAQAAAGGPGAVAIAAPQLAQAAAVAGKDREVCQQPRNIAPTRIFLMVVCVFLTRLALQIVNTGLIKS